MANGLRLRDYQRRGVEIFGSLPEPRRFFFTWDMGAGKTLGALSVAKAHNRRKILIVCPAMVRGVWLQNCAKVLGHLQIGSLVHGRERKALTRQQRADRTAALESDALVVSYDLVGNIPAQGWDFIILDEFHSLRSHLSKQSRSIRALFRANPKAWAVGLSGTPIPNEAAQLWNPVDTFFPGLWGRQTNPKYIPYGFVKKFCNWLENEDDRFPGKFYGLKAEMRPELERMFGKLSLRVKQEDFAKYLPPRVVEPLPVEKVPEPVSLAKQWLAHATTQTKHVGIYTYKRETAWAIYQAVQKMDCFALTHHTDGSQSPAHRAAILTSLRQSTSSCLVATADSLKEGISLSFQKAALIVEWTTDVAKVTQFIGRFARQDSVDLAPTRVQFVVGPNDVSKSETLLRRMEDISATIGASNAIEDACGVFRPAEMTDEVFEQELAALAQAHEKRSNLWGGEEDGEGDE